jgi:amino acid transporter
MDMEEIARWAFIAFVFIAIVMGLVVGFMNYNGDPNYADINAYVTLAMLIIGILIGLISITTKEVMPFLIATVALAVVSNTDVWAPLGMIHPLLHYWAMSILHYIVAFAAPAAVINAVKAVFAMAREK